MIPGSCRDGVPAAALALCVLAAAGSAAHAESGIAVLNQQSYSEVGEEWTVWFDAPAGALEVVGDGDTQIGRDVGFVRLGGLQPASDGGRLTFQWQGGAGELVMLARTPGTHGLVLESGGSQARAYNDAYTRTASKITGGGAADPLVSPGDQFGLASAGIGDVDGDGVPDIAVGSPSRSSNAGAVQVVMLNADGTARAASSVAVSGVAAGDQLGRAVAGIGDINRDGIPDIAVGSPGRSSNAGAVQVVMLNADGTAKSLGASIPAPAQERGDIQFGFSVAGIGDIDGDGIPDMVAGAPARNARTGSAYVMLLNADGTVKRTVEMVNPEGTSGRQQGNAFGSSVAGIGDIDGDGIPDMAAGASGKQSNTGAAYVVLLNADGTAKSTQSMLGADGSPSVAGGDSFGTSVAGIGDIDGDGVPDAAVGATVGAGGGRSRGTVHVILLTDSGGIKGSYQINGTSPHIPSSADFDLFGASLALVGDIDRDGRAELAVGVPGDDEHTQGFDGGAVYIVRLDHPAPAGSGEARYAGPVGNDAVSLPVSGGDELGYAIASIGDINDDGVPDVAVGARSDDTGGRNRGAAYVVMMNADGSVDKHAKIASGTGGGPVLANGDNFGSGVTGTGDMDGDGIPDIAVGAGGTGSGSSASVGAAYLLLLNRDGTAKSSTRIDSSTELVPRLIAGDVFGDSISSADLDADGTADIAVGAPGYTGRGTGAVHVLLMNQDRTVKSASTIRDGSGVSISAQDSFGEAVSFVGDLDGDGVPDLAVGSRWDDNGGSSNNGALHVLLMNRNGTVKSAQEVNAGTANGPSLRAGDWFGSGVAGVGDMDGDQIPDIVVGAGGDDAPGFRNSGVLHVLFMKSDALPKRTQEIPVPQGLAGVSHHFGESVASADINGDGDPDLVAGAPGASSNAGDVYVMLMSGTRVSGTAAVSESGPDLPQSAADMIGGAVAGIGDIDRDGIPDMAMGAAGDDTGGTDKGGVYVLFMGRDGRPDSHAAINDGTIPAPPLSLGDGLGGSVAGIGDIDRDGVPDIAAGAPLSDGSNDFGQVRIIQMNSDGTVKRNTVIRDGSTGIVLGAGDRFGSASAGIGDIDGNGVPDMAVGAPFADSVIQSGPATGTDRGAMFVMLMSYGTGGPSWSAIKVPRDHALDLQDHDMLGYSVAGVGDIDGNGVPDIAAGAPGDDGRGASGAERGAVHVLLMSSTGVMSASKIGDSSGGGPAISGDHWFGASVAGVGDLDRDGVPDIAAGAPRSGGGGTGWVLLMNADGTAKRAVEFGDVPGLSGGDRMGSSIAVLGDLDRDGTAEIAVGAPYHDDDGNDNKGVIRIMSLFRPAVVSGVGSHTDDGTYGIGQTVGVSVRFTQSVEVTGVPSLALETGASDGSASYVSGSGTGELSFEYTVREGDVSGDLGYVSVSSLAAPGGSVEWAGRAAALEMPRPGTRDSLSFAKALVIDGTRPELEGAPRLDLSSGVLELDFDKVIDISETDSGGVVVHAGGSRTSLQGAALPAGDTDAPVLRLTGEQTRRIIEAHLGAGPPLIDISGEAFSDLVGNHFAGVSGRNLDMSLTLLADEAGVSDSARAYKSGLAPSDPTSVSDSASARGEYLRPASDAPAASDSARAYRSGVPVSDSPAAADSAEAYKSGASASDAPAVSDSIRAERRLVQHASGAPTVSDSARAYRSGLQASDSPAVSSSARAYVSGAAASDSPAVSDSARAYVSGVPASDSPAVSDSARAHVSGSAASDSPAVSDSARAYVSGSAASDSPTVSDSAGLSVDSVSASSDTAAVSDSARAYVSGVPASDSPAVSDSARAYVSGTAASDSPAVSDSASFAGMLVQSLADAASVSDSARSYVSGIAASDSPAVSDSAASSGMLVQSLADAASVSDSVRAYVSGAVASDSPPVSDSASFAGMLVQGVTDAPAAADSARAYRSGIVLSDSPAVADFASGRGAFSALLSDQAVVSGSARAYKSGTSASDAPAASDGVQWGSMRAASGSDSPGAHDSARAYKSSAQAEDVPAHASGARAGRTAAIVTDAPQVSDGAATGQPPAVAADRPALYDNVILYVEGPEPQGGGKETMRPGGDGGGDGGMVDAGVNAGGGGRGGSAGGSRGGSGAGGNNDAGPALGGSGNTGVATVAIHGVSWDRCSEDPHVLVVAGPGCELGVTLSEQGGLAAAEATGVPGAPPDSCVWRAPVSAEAREVSVRAVHAGTAISDTRTLSMDSCSGWAPFTPFAERAGIPVHAASETQDSVKEAPVQEHKEEITELPPVQVPPASPAQPPAPPASPPPATPPPRPGGADLTTEPGAADSILPAGPEADRQEPGADAVLWAGAAAAGALAAGLALAIRARGRA